MNSLKLRKGCGIGGIPNECLRYLPRRSLIHLTRLFNYCLRLSHFPRSWNDTKVITLLELGKTIIEKILNIVQKHIEQKRPA
jgi:hypothetical protein